uniref:(California timema) hypothetical protein n=1 Tax=Timema californicum TaxID=61474 RepID=A0A7R9PFB0_TIMCA|nr:unnamed protein product [Timema californicum]
MILTTLAVLATVLGRYWTLKKSHPPDLLSSAVNLLMHWNTKSTQPYLALSSIREENNRMDFLLRVVVWMDLRLRVVVRMDLRLRVVVRMDLLLRVVVRMDFLLGVVARMEFLLRRPVRGIEADGEDCEGLIEGLPSLPASRDSGWRLVVAFMDRAMFITYLALYLIFQTGLLP